MATQRLRSFPRAAVLVLGSNIVQTLLPSTLIAQADALLEAHRLEDAAELAEQRRKKLQAIMTVERHELDELRYVNQRLGFQLFTETLFDDAGKRLFEGELDPRVLVSYYPELRGNLFSETDSVDVMAGVAELMPTADSVDDLISNYSPHLAPNTREAPPTVELRSILSMAARDMLESFLRKWRRKLAVDAAAPDTPAIRVVVDTVLAKLLVTSDKTSDLYALVEQPNSVSLEELEPVLVKARKFDVLCRLHQQRGNETELLQIWAKLVDGEWEDPAVQDPLSRIFELLQDRRDKALIQQWLVWLTKKDSERALRLLTTTGGSRRRADDDRALLQQLQEADTSAGAQFLEHVVIHKRSTDPELHSQLALAYADQLAECLADDTTSKLWRAKASSYSSSRSDTPFILYFATTTPDSDPKRTRLKAALFLQGSALYDAAAVLARLEPHAKALRLEHAVLLGKLGRHRDALAVLVHELNDAASAETYCTLGGEVVPARTAQAIGERVGLQPWAVLVVPFAASGRAARPAAAGAAIKRQKTVDEEVKKDLIMTLLEVYMAGGEATADRTAKLLSSQAMNLEVLDVVSIIPPQWPVKILSTFVTRSLRRTLHARHEGQIVKAISQGQNLAVAEQTYSVIREQGAVVEEPLDDDDEEEETGEKLGLDLGEKIEGQPASFDEKVGLHLPSTPPGVVDVDVARRKVGWANSHPGHNYGVGT